MALNSFTGTADIVELKHLLLVISLLLAHTISARESVSATIMVRVNLAPSVDSSTKQDTAACDLASLTKSRDHRNCQDYQIDTEENDDHVHLTVIPI